MAAVAADLDLEDDVQPQQVLNLFQVVALIFFAVSGGPYGFEDVVGSAGGYVAIFAVLMLPFFWSFPMGLMTAELSSLLPENGGYIIWVNRAFGPFVAWFNSVSGMFCAVFDNAIYPVIFVDYINTLLEETDQDRMSRPLELIIKAGVISVVSYINVLGVDAVGGATIVFGVMVMCPFALLVMAGLPRVSERYQVSPPIPQHSIEMGSFLAVMAWNNCGWDNIGNAAAEIVDPARTLPRAMSIAVSLITLNYFMPLLVALPVAPDPAKWTDGAWVAVGARLGGPLLSHTIALMAMVSALGMFSALLCTSSRLMYGIAMEGHLPAWLTYLHPKTNTPLVAILLNSAICLVVTCVPGVRFADIAQMSMVFYMSTTIFKFAALVRLRYVMADAPRPYRIPLGNGLLALFIIPPVLTCMVAVYYSPWYAWVGLAVALGLSVVTHTRSPSKVLRRGRSNLNAESLGLSSSLPTSPDSQAATLHQQQREAESRRASLKAQGAGAGHRSPLARERGGGKEEGTEEGTAKGREMLPMPTPRATVQLVNGPHGEGGDFSLSDTPPQFREAAAHSAAGGGARSSGNTADPSSNGRGDLGRAPSRQIGAGGAGAGPAEGSSTSPRQGARGGAGQEQRAGGGMDGLLSWFGWGARPKKVADS